MQVTAPPCCFVQVASKVPLMGTLDHELQMLHSLQGLEGVPSLASDSLVHGAIVMTPILQLLAFAVIWRDCLHQAVPALVSTFQVCASLQSMLQCDSSCPLCLWMPLYIEYCTHRCTWCSVALFWDPKRFAMLPLCCLIGGAGPWLCQQRCVPQQPDDESHSNTNVLFN